jgi:rRNA processing protein Krr1/Pno1
MAILRASERKTLGGASPASPRNTSADPRGLISGRSTLKAIKKAFQSNKAISLTKSYFL